MFASGQALSNGAVGFLFLNMVVKKERHGRTMTAALETSHTFTEEATDTTQIYSTKA